MHTGNRHLKNHRGFSVAFSNGCSVVFSDGISLFSCMFKRIATCPVDVYWNFPIDVQCRFPMELWIKLGWRFAMNFQRHLPMDSLYFGGISERIATPPVDFPWIHWNAQWHPPRWFPFPELWRATFWSVTFRYSRSRVSPAAAGKNFRAQGSHS